MPSEKLPQLNDNSDNFVSLNDATALRRLFAEAKIGLKFESAEDAKYEKILSGIKEPSLLQADKIRLFDQLIDFLEKKLIGLAIPKIGKNHPR